MFFNLMNKLKYYSGVLKFLKFSCHKANGRKDINWLCLETKYTFVIIWLPKQENLWPWTSGHYILEVCLINNKNIVIIVL